MSAQAALDRYRRDDTDLSPVPSLTRQFHFVALLRASDSGGSSPSEVYSCEEEVSGAVVLAEAHEEY